ncbi:MAG: hypothetical protein P8N14_05120 [Sulfitobacter sp.]|nr:hypothetical protein [Sulfitobacter sp.]
MVRLSGRTTVNRSDSKGTSGDMAALSLIMPDNSSKGGPLPSIS